MLIICLDVFSLSLFLPAYLEPEVSHSDFRGHFYAKLHFEHTEVLQIQLTMQIYSLDGLILYNEGQVPGSFVAMYVEKGAAKMCLNCGIEAECQESVDLQVRCSLF